MIHKFCQRDVSCKFCHAILWSLKKYWNQKQPKFPCCYLGNISLPLQQPTPTFLKELLIGNNTISNYFKSNIRLFNSILSFTSSSCKVDRQLLSADCGTYTYRISGNVHHSIGSYLPENGEKPKFSQIYIYDKSFQTKIRNDMFPELKKDILEKLQDLLHEHNPYVQIFQQVGKKLQTEPSKQINIVLKNNYDKDKRYNTPSSDEIAVLMVNDFEDSEKVNTRDIIIYPKAGSLKRISELHSSYDPLQYVLMFVRGEKGWQPKTIKFKSKTLITNTAQLDDNYTENEYNNCLDLSNENGENFQENINTSDKYITAMQYYAHKIYEKNGDDLHLFGRLFHQYIVDQYSKIELGRLNFIKFNQDKLRVDMYKGLMESITKNDHIKPDSVGRKIILPSSFTGGPRHMHQLYQDAMSIVRAFGKPDLFVTFTCNPKWSEIEVELIHGQTANDRPDLIVRVFRQKSKEFLNDILKNQIFGKVLAHIYVVEFQKRDLPHIHILLILDKPNKPVNVSDYDSIVKAEIPDPKRFPKLHENVSKCMVHGPCGKLFPKSPCMKDGKCSKKFPKNFCNATEDNGKGY